MVLRHRLCAVHAIAVFVCLTGCSSYVPMKTATSPTFVRHIESRSGSWMLPEASTEDLLYVTNYSKVLVYTYPAGKLVGTLKGFSSSVGECVDAKGDVFITNYEPVTVFEYAHGGTKPIAQFPTKKSGNYGCAINPLNGDLAISGGTRFVEVFRGANPKSKPEVFQDKGMGFGQFCAYDNDGNLFFDGVSPTHGQRLSELPVGSSEFAGITLSKGMRFQVESSIQWDGTYLTVLTYVPWGHGSPKLLQLRILDNARGEKAGEVSLGAPANTVLQYFLTNGTAVIPNIRALSGQNSTVLLYKYRSGGSPYSSIRKNINDARGVVVSYAS